MKNLLITFFIIPMLGYGQSNEFGKISNDTLILKSGEKYWKGKEIRIGYGSNGSKGFEFITLSPWSIAGPVPLGPAWSNLKMTVKEFQFSGTKRTGKKFYIVAKGGNLSPYWIDIVSALDHKEVISETPDQETKESIAKPDIADQIKKLKELKDAGALTQEQYDKALKKVLEN